MWKSGINSAAEQGFGDRLTVDIYPQGKSSFSLYEDDRVTRDYKQDKSATQLLEVNAPVAARGDVTVKIGASRGSYAGKPSTRPYELTVHTGTAPRDVTMGNVASSPSWSARTPTSRPQPAGTTRTAWCW